MKTANKIFLPAIHPLPLRRKITATPGNERFCKAFTFLKKYYYEPIGVGDLAKASKLSRRGLHKTFHKHVGQGPGRELRRLRMERAMSLLIISDHDLKVIAKRCGYRSKNSFWVSFREFFGEAPEEFRSRFRSNFSRQKKLSYSHSPANATIVRSPNTTDMKWFDRFSKFRRLPTFA